MIGKTRKTPSGLLLPDMSHPAMQHIGRTGELPLIAGGAPVWPMSIKPQSQVFEVNKLANISGSFSRNLLEECAPTIMEQWSITDIRIPVTLVPSTEAAEPELGISYARYAINLLYGGELVWSNEEIIRESLKNNGRASFSSVFAGNLNQPIIIERGRALLIEVAAEVIFNKPPAAKANFTLYLGGFPPREGRITYTSHKLSGHRTF